ncbi:MAG: hypothetical protein AAF589_09045 [Planctomycetota bacterium]
MTCLAALLACAEVSDAQRVQIPATAPATFGAAPVGPSAGAIGPAPSFDAYAPGGAIGPPPTVPYTYAQPPLAPNQTFAAPPLGAQPAYGQPAFGQPAFGQPAPQAFGQPQPALSPNGLPLSWEPGTYGYEQADGSLVRFQQFVQKLDGEYTHLFGGGSADDLQLNRVQVTSTFAWPVFGNIDAPLLLTPGFVYNAFDDSAFAPFPGDVFDAYLDAAWFPQINEAVGAELGFRTGVWSDFDEVNSDSVRLLGRGLVVVRMTPTAEFLAGVVYLDRKRIKLLPAGGVRWRPTPDIEVDAVFPNPAIRRRINAAGQTDWWVFLAGEYGGGSWTHELDPDGFDYNDLRVSIGLEFETPSQITGTFEVGYAFDREIYRPTAMGPVVLEFDDTVMLRAGINL